MNDFFWFVEFGRRGHGDVAYVYVAGDGSADTQEDAVLEVIKLLNEFGRKCEQEEPCRPNSLSSSSAS